MALARVTRLPASAALPYALRRDTGGAGGGAGGAAAREEALAAFLKSRTRTTVGRVLETASRVATRRRPAAALKGVAATDWFRLDAKDDITEKWYPQGLSCGSDAGLSSPAAFAISWYWKPDPAAEPERGIRVSFLNVATLKYAHVLLVEPDAAGNPVPINVHAGGLAWYKNLLYVPDTTGGLRVFDLRNLCEGGLFGYSFTLPQSDMWSCDQALGARFSFATLDRSADPVLLVSGEYLTSGTGRVVRWALAADGSLATDEEGTAVPVDAYNSPGQKIQGAVSYKGRWYFSQSGGTGPNDRLLTALPGQPVEERNYPKGPEDLTVWRGKSTVWTIAEKPGGRVILGVPL
ncbi:hypothetical protein [Microtetraspora sp. NBRC 16547]|uniref:hypothetical protein n=1 Tax=Microtetraspora sp. NBRC 16547 TaxID=3030993 RepID=UPI0024A25203|nr:hypothetical protein [Microtetraspora sp. NBRC 16547]GLX01592.1 hypothetical protein Misp02_56780 [Microtetraspora sp. NBRC 16547]